jgi:hypothetical protein
MLYGSKPADGGYLLLTNDEYEAYIIEEPQGKEFIRPFASAREFIHNEKRWCFWLLHADPSLLNKCPILLKRIEAVRISEKKAKNPKPFRMLRNLNYLQKFGNLIKIIF